MSTTRSPRTLLPAVLAGVLLVATACSDGGGGGGDAGGATTTGADQAVATSTVAAGGDATALADLFLDGALVEEADIVDCELEDGTASTCYRLTVPSQPTTVETGPFCPSTVDDDHGIFVWDGEDPGLYGLDADFWAMLAEQGYAFTDDDGTVHVADPAAGPSSAGDTCLQATADDSYTLQVLVPATPTMLDEPTDLGTVSQIGIARDGVVIFGDAPSGTSGAIPALDPCGGHDDPSGYYHWHFGSSTVQDELDAAGIELTCGAEQDHDALLGFAYDGFAIYGTTEADGTTPEGLDGCNGHVGATADLGETYHYHLVEESPNLPPCRVGAAAVDKLTSPDNPDASLPDGGGPGGAGGPGGPGGPPPGQAPSDG